VNTGSDGPVLTRRGWLTVEGARRTNGPRWNIPITNGSIAITVAEPAGAGFRTAAACLGPSPRRYTLALRTRLRPAREVSAGARYQVSPQDDRRDPRDDSASRDRHHHRRSAPRGSPRHGHLGACHGRGGLTLTRFCDSYRLHALLRAHKLAHADGGELRLVTPLTARSSYLRPDLPGPLDTLLRQPGRGP